WRLRPSTAADQIAVREFIHESPGNAAAATSQSVTPERVEAEMPFKEGERARIGIETPRTGYLYVINRARYAGGTSGNPYLIFPTMRIGGGDCRVKAGHVIEIPARTDTPPYLTLRRSKSPQGAKEVSEEFIGVVTSLPLSDVKTGADRYELNKKQLARWEQQWAAKSERWELIDGAGKPYTKTEKEAAEGTRELAQGDPFPQTIYSVAARPDRPIMVRVRLPIRN